MNQLLHIKMPRGDIRPVSFCVEDENGDASDILFDEIYFTVKDQFKNPRYVLQKTLTGGDIERNQNGEYEFVLAPEDTQDLRFANYDFDIEILYGTVIKETFMGILELTPECTHAGNEARP